MDTLFTLPVISIFILPALSSYGTSLNVIFFYITWTTLVLSHSPLRVELFGIIATRLLCYVLPSVLFFLFDVLTPSAAVVIKAQGEYGLPTGNKRAKIRVQEFKVAGWALANLTLSIVVQAVIEEILTRGFRIRSAIRVSVKLPMPWDMAKTLLYGFLLREILAYYIHRYILHRRTTWTSWIAKHHESWYHSLRTPFPLSAHYDHPAVYLFANFLPSFVPAMLLRFHMLTYVVYMVLISIEETFAYSGYSVMPTSFFLGGIARRMDSHLLNGGEGNFGPWGILDWINGTAVEDDEDEEDDGLEERVRKAVDKSTKRRQDRHKLKKRRGVDH